MSVKGHDSIWRSWWRKTVACGLELRERGYPRMKYKPYHIDFPFGGPDITSFHFPLVPARHRQGSINRADAGLEEPSGCEDKDSRQDEVCKL